MLYSTFTAYLGFAVNEDEYKVMGLAAYGRPTMVDQVRKLIRRTPDGAFALAPEYFEYQTTASAIVFVAIRGPVRTAAHAVRADRHGDDRRPALRRLRRQRPARARRHTGGHRRARSMTRPASRICASAAASRSTAWRTRAFSPSRASNGCSCRRRPAMPAARSAPRSMPTASTSRTQTGTCPIIRSGVRPWMRGSSRGPRLRTARRWRSSTTRAMVERIADDLAAGRVVGWMDGASEFGPRALGHRSILAAPQSREMRDRLNRDIKRREEFRPFAPVTPLEAADRYFELPAGGARLGRFMSGVFPVRPEWRDALGAITHVDGSARVQTLDQTMAPRLHALLEAYGSRSGHAGAAQHVVQRRGRADRQSRAGGLLHVSALRHRRARRRIDAGDEARGAPRSRRGVA